MWFYLFGSVGCPFSWVHWHHLTETVYLKWNRRGILCAVEYTWRHDMHGYILCKSNAEFVAFGMGDDDLVCGDMLDSSRDV